MGFKRMVWEGVHRLRTPFLEARARLFCELLKPYPGVRILDLGGGEGQFSTRITQHIKAAVTVADILDYRAEVTALGFEFVLLQEGVPLPFDTQEFDIVICNSVIEHVTLPKELCRTAVLDDAEWHERAYRAQAAFATEIRRVGRGYFVQTPHRHFPIDLHMWLPFTNWLSHRQVVRVANITDRYWIKWTGDRDWNLLDVADMRRLFPDGQVVVERLIGLPKSIVAYNRPPS